MALNQTTPTNLTHGTTNKMANIVKGEFQLPNGLTLVLDYNAMCELENITDIPFYTFLERFTNAQPRLSDARAFVWACLQRHHSKLSLAEAGELVAEYGMDMIGELMTRAFPTETAEPGNAPAPAKRGRK